MQFNNSWLGYDLPFEKIEGQDFVRTLRTQGIEKRVKAPEHHVTAAYFESVSLEALTETLAMIERETGRPFDTTEFLFDGYGTIDFDKGKYVYLSPAVGSQAAVLKQFLSTALLYNAEKNCSDLHLSIGGPDPFSREKPKQQPLLEPFSLVGKLVFVGNDGKGFRKYAWNSQTQAFEELNAAAPAAPQISQPIPVKTIAIFPKIQPDTVAAVFLLKKYGEKAFPGVTNAEVVYWTSTPAGKTADTFEREGVLLIDLAGSRFDHHRDDHGKKTECASSLVAKFLGIENKPELRKLLLYVKRDDLEGKGTLSTDPLDRAFGLSGIIMNLNRVHGENPQSIFDFVAAIFEAHVYDERQRTVEMPIEWKDLKAAGKASESTVKKDGQLLRLATVESDNTSLPGFLRAYLKIDVVIQRLSSGHTNIITRQALQLNLREVISRIRLEEAKMKGVSLADDPEALRKPGRLEGIDEWFYDTAANTIQNGGINPQNIVATRLPFKRVQELVQQGLEAKPQTN